MADYYWNGAISQDASVAGNWVNASLVPYTSIPSPSDKVIFNSIGVQPCNFNIPAINEMDIQSDNIQQIDIQIAIALNGLKINSAEHLFTSGSYSFTFSGTIPYKSNSCYVEIGIAGSPFADVNSRQNFTWSFVPTSGDVYFDCGIYPHVKVSGGTFTPQYVAPTLANATKVQFLSLNVITPNFAPVSNTPTDNDKLKEFIIEDNSTSQIQVDASVTSNSTFDGGYATWTFQGISTGFLIPTPNLVEYRSVNFKFKKMVISAESAGAGAWAKIAQGARLQLSDLTISVGASLKGAGPSAIHLINRPNIKGTWGFFPVADGIYHHKDGELLGVKSGGIGVDYIPEKHILFSGESNNLETDSKLTWEKSTSELIVDGKLTVTGLIDPTGMVFTPQATNPEATNPLDTIWINSEDGHLYRGERDTESTVHFNVRNDEGSIIPVGAPLYSKGEIGGSNRIKVGIADASDPNKMPAIGLAMEEMNTTSTKDGNMILTGILNGNITITGVVEQDIIYVAPHGGSAPYLTITRPTSGSHLIQNVGVCVRQSATNVSQGMKVAAIGRTNDIPNATITTNSADADYVYIDDGNTFKKITPSDLGIGGGGGGSGTVTSVATTAPITGGTITSTGTLGFDISSLTANTAIADADLLFMDDGANGTNRKVTFDEVAQWIRGEGVKVGRNGGVNKLRIRDSRDDGALTPDDWNNTQVSFDFTDQYSSLLPSAYWANVITLKGWTDSYRVAQLMTSATSEGTNQSNKDTEPLYFRSGEDSGWGVMREVLTFPIGTSGSTPNADGAANQILQTDGAGTLSWANLPTNGTNLYWDDANNRLGIGTNTPEHTLHVVGTGNYPIRIQGDEGNLRLNKYGHLQIQNDNSSPLDGATIDSPLFQIGQRDSGQLDIAFGALSNQLVAAGDALLTLKRDSNSATGAKQIGFLGATAAGQQTVVDPASAGFSPMGATPNELALQTSLDSIIAALQTFGLFA